MLCRTNQGQLINKPIHKQNLQTKMPSFDNLIQLWSFIFTSLSLNTEQTSQLQAVSSDFTKAYIGIYIMILYVMPPFRNCKQITSILPLYVCTCCLGWYIGHLTLIFLSSMTHICFFYHKNFDFLANFQRFFIWLFSQIPTTL